MTKLKVFHYKPSDDFIIQGHATESLDGLSRLHDLTLINLKTGKGYSIYIGALNIKKENSGLNQDTILVDEEWVFDAK